jgi:hypothetical protein
VAKAVATVVAAVVAVVAGKVDRALKVVSLAPKLERSTRP